MNMTSGTAYDLTIGSGTLNLSGGSLTAPNALFPIQMDSGIGALNVYGSGLSFVPSTVGAPNGTVVTGISGTLLDGSTIDVNVLVNGFSSYDINLFNVPEPSTLAMALIASAVGIGCAARRHFGAVSFGRWGG